jgi:hypothetical protein
MCCCLDRWDYQTMESVFVEHPLLNSPHLVSLILRSAAEGAGTIDACMERLSSVMRKSAEPPTLAPEEIRALFQRLVEHLSYAKLIAVENETIVITERGRAALRRSPEGFATADLMAYPEYAAFVQKEGRNRATSNPHANAYDQGADARRKGLGPGDNPYQPDTEDHNAWVYGWSS